MIDPTIARIMCGEFQEVHASLRSGDGRTISDTEVVGVRIVRDNVRFSVDFDRPISLSVTSAGANVVLHLETADCVFIMDLDIREYVGSHIRNLFVGTTLDLFPGGHFG